MVSMPFGLVVWAHKTNDSDWSDASYTRLYEINTVEQFWGCVKVMQDFMEELMFFVMLNDAVPRWEHESNRHGGYFSVRVENKCMKQAFESLLCKMVCGSLMRNEDSTLVGISTSSKGKFGILKAWMRTCCVTDNKMIAIDGVPKNSVRFTPHTGKYAETC